MSRCPDCHSNAIPCECDECKDCQDLQTKLDLAVEALKYYAMDLLVDPCLSDIIFDSIKHKCTTCKTATTGVTSCDDDKIGEVARVALQKITDSEVE